MGQGRWLGLLTLGAVTAAGFLSGSLWHGQLAEAVPTNWSAVSSASSDSGSSLDAVSCVSTTFCLAVGNDASTQRGVIEEDDGSGWTAISDPETSLDLLSNVSCVSEDFCVVVGSTPDDNEEPIVETWNGTTMTVVPSPTVAVGQSSFLVGVSCTSTTFCVAVGFTDFSSQAALIEMWNGVAWSITSAPHSGTGNTDSLDNVSCTSDVACTAVGSTSTGSNVVPVAESWNGQTWSVEPTPAPGPNAQLFDVSCPSSSTCMAVGEILAVAEPDQGPNQIFAESWNGSSWVASTISDASTNDGLVGVSCADSTDCVAVGYDTSSSASQVLDRCVEWHRVDTIERSLPAIREQHTFGRELLGPGRLSRGRNAGFQRECTGTGGSWLVKRCHPDHDDHDGFHDDHDGCGWRRDDDNVDAGPCDQWQQHW